MILVYTHKITPRIKYIFKHIFTVRLGVEIDITSDLEYFNYSINRITENCMRLSYCISFLITPTIQYFEGSR